MARQRRPRDDDPPGHGFDEFYEANVQRLTLTLYAYTADLHLAQDCVQEAFTRAWPRWQRLVAYDNPAAWIRRVAMNIASSRWQRMRAARAHAHLHRDTVVDGPGPERVALARALATLPERQPSTPPSPTPDGQPTGEPATPTLQQSDVPTGFRYEGDSIRGDWTLEFAASTCEPPNPLAGAPSAITQWEALFRTGSDPDEYLAIHQRVADYGTADAAEAYLEAVRRLAQGCVSILDEPSTWTVERQGFAGDESLVLGSDGAGYPSTYIVVRVDNLVTQIWYPDAVVLDPVELGQRAATRLCAGTTACRAGRVGPGGAGPPGPTPRPRTWPCRRGTAAELGVTRSPDLRSRPTASRH